MKVLVTAASKHGTTAEIAEAIAKVLRTTDLEVDIIAPNAVHELADYDAVVLGSGVYAGHWLKPARAFVDRHEGALQGPTGVPVLERADRRSAATSRGSGGGRNDRRGQQWPSTTACSRAA